MLHIQTTADAEGERLDSAKNSLSSKSITDRSKAVHFVVPQC